VSRGRENAGDLWRQRRTRPAPSSLAGQPLLTGRVRRYPRSFCRSATTPICRCITISGAGASSRDFRDFHTGGVRLEGRYGRR